MPWAPSHLNSRVPTLQESGAQLMFMSGPCAPCSLFCVRDTVSTNPAYGCRHHLLHVCRSTYRMIHAGEDASADKDSTAHVSQCSEDLMVGEAEKLHRSGAS